MLSLAHRFLFVHVPKTAGNAVHRVLLPYSEDRMVQAAPHHDGMDRFEVRSPHFEMHKHLSLSEYRDRLAPPVFGEVFKFCCVRNPWDRCVSHFFSPHRGKVAWTPEAFEAFVDEQVVPAEAYVRLTPDDRDPFSNLDAVLRFEHLDSDFPDVCHRIGIGPLTLPTVNAGTHGDYRGYYVSARLRERVRSKFALEIETFGYEFG